MSTETAPTIRTKITFFAKKSGFVIPKNKLSGSLIPALRGTKKGDNNSVNEEAGNRVQRKTKWGPDLTVDSTVRKGRALAYQARINQISQQLDLGELDDNQDPSEFDDGKSSNHQLSREKELLELERREIIGELLKLNPSYKAPADYKPLLKEAIVPIPITEYPGYNFIALVFGPASETQKRLEKETGAKIRVYGTKADTAGKFEVTPADGKEMNRTYQELYVHVSADTFEKIDAAVTLIELLVTPVSVNPVSSPPKSTTVSDDTTVPGPSQNTPSPLQTPPSINQGVIPQQPYPGSLPPRLQGPYQQNPQSWYPLTGQTLTNSSSTFNPVQPSSSTFNPSNAPLFLGPPRQTNFSSRPQYLQQALPGGPIGRPHNNIPLPNLPSVTTEITTLPRPPHDLRPTWTHQSTQHVNKIVPPFVPPQGQHNNPVPNVPFTMSGNHNPTNFDPIAIPRPRNSSDFTFQPHHRPQNTVPRLSWRSGAPANHNLTPQMNIANPSNAQGFPRHHQMNQPRPQITMTSPRLPPTHMQPRNFIPPYDMVNSAGPFPPRAASQMNFRPQRFQNPNPRFNNYPGRPFSVDTRQIYDPFSPTSVRFNRPMGGNGPRPHNEDDPEYDDLMASVGVI